MRASSLPSRASSRPGRIPLVARLLPLVVALAVAACHGGRPAPARAAAAADPDAVLPLSRMAFGSCNRESLPQPLWAPILAERPQLWLWLGDNVYADTDVPAEMQRKYARQLADPGYAALRARVPVVGTWDDHDYGRNDAGAEYPMRAASQRLFLDFLGVPVADARRTRQGVYAAHVYGPRGRRVKVLLLDVRYHREAPGATSDILGEEQWRWLEGELRGSDAQVHVLASGIQVLPEDHRFEKWANFPAARARLLTLLRATRAPGVVLLSGDRHFAEISRMDGALDYPLYEMTSSGLTHSYRLASEANRHRVGPIWTGLHYGLMELAWDGEPRLTLSIRDSTGAARLTQSVALRAIRPRRR